MTNTELYTRYLDKEEFLDRYLQGKDPEESCRFCPNYGNRWSCPPGTPDARSYLEPYKSLCLVALKVNYPEEIRRKAEEDEAYVRQIREDTYMSGRKELLMKLLDAEKKIPGSKIIAAGGCLLCEHCSREEGKPCRKPELRRYSFSVFGLDFGKMLEEVFGFRLLWAAKGLPEYDVSLAALFFPEGADAGNCEKIVVF